MYLYLQFFWRILFTFSIASPFLSPLIRIKGPYYRDKILESNNSKRLIVLE